MIIDTVLQHKQEKENLLRKDYILREKLDFGKKFLDSDLLKIISGPRRAGKSVFSILLLRDKNFAYLNFDDENLIKVKNYDDIVKSMYEVYPDCKYVLFDEIQNLDKWEIFVNKLQRRGVNLVLTGSNANLLKKELGTKLTGRYVPIEIFPFSFREVLKTKNLEITKDNLSIPEFKGRILNYLDEYLKNGGFPEVIVKNLDTKVYLETLFDAILFKDVVKRYNVRFSQKIYDLAVYLMTNFSSEYSFTKLRNILQFRSTITIQNYLKYLEEAYLLFPLSRFSFKMKEQIKAPKKIYLVDNGFGLGKSFQFLQNTGKLMENEVFIEILKRGYKLNSGVFYYKTRNGREIDFVLKEGITIKSLIQVCYKITDLFVKEREVKSLIEAGSELKCDNLLVINWEYENIEEYKGKKINFIPLWKWLIE